MGFDFLHEHNGQRLRYVPPMTDDLDWAEEDADETEVDRSVEMSPSEWQTIDVLGSAGADHLLPCRFIDGCHRGQTVAWVQDIDGHPVPVMLAEIGSVCLGQQDRKLRREFEIVERVRNDDYRPVSLARNRSVCTRASRNRPQTVTGQSAGR